MQRLWILMPVLVGVFASTGCVSSWKYDDLKTQVGTLERQVFTLKSERDSLKSRAQHDETDLQRLSDQLKERDAALQKMLTKAAEERKVVEQQLAAIRTKSEDLATHNKALLTDLAGLRNRYETTVVQGTAMQQQLQELKKATEVKKPLSAVERALKAKLRKAQKPKEAVAQAAAAPVSAELAPKPTVTPTAVTTPTVPGGPSAALKVGSAPSSAPVKPAGPAVLGASSGLPPSSSAAKPVANYNLPKSAVINRASMLDLMRVGFSDQEAMRTIHGRPYRDWDDLRKRSGLSQPRLETLKEKTTLD